MADLSDVTFKIAELAGAAVYPNGVGQTSVSGQPVRVYEGWPLPDRLDLDIAGQTRDGDGVLVPTSYGPVSHISIFPMNGSITSSQQVFEPEFVLIPPQHTITALIVDQTVTFSGAPVEGEFVSIIADGRHGYSRVGASLAEICQQLAADAQADYPAASFTGTSVTIPAASLIARIGAKAVMGKLIHRQKQAVMVTIWAPTPEVRTTLASAVDILMKQNLRIVFPDTSQAILTYDRTNQIDDRQSEGIYRRDLIYTAEYGTIETFDSYEVTVFTVQTSADDGAPVTTAS